ncbi:MAG: hypothetical protein Kow0088_06650 [Anaerolineales bacterium]
MNRLTRREFLKLGGYSLAGFVFGTKLKPIEIEPFPQGEKLGRAFAKVELKAKPDVNSATVGVLYDDAVVVCLRELVGSNPYRYRQRFVETPQGYVWASDLQPCQNRINVPVETLPQTSLGPGMWVEVTIPWVDVRLERGPFSPGFKYRLENQFPIRMYYSQILWVDKIEKDEQGQIWYRINEKYGYGDVFWAKAEAFRPLTQRDVSPIHPDVEEKLVVINVEEKVQTLSCFEGTREVYFCRVAAGKKFDAEGNFLGHSSTPTGTMLIWRKLISTHMSGGTTGAGYDLPGIGWTTLFTGDGVAIHSTFWHNNFGGELMSHGCVNARPEDAQWVFRWTNPPVQYDPGELYSKDTEIPPTKIKVIEG